MVFFLGGGGGGHCLFSVRDRCTDFEPYSKVYNLVSGHANSIKLCQMTTHNVIFYNVVVSFY